MKTSRLICLVRPVAAWLLVAGILLPFPLTAAVKVASKTLDAYVGQYELEPGKFFNIRRQDDHLTCQIANEGMVNLVPKSEKDFVAREVPEVEFTFKTDNQGKVTHLVFHKGGGDYDAPKRSDRAPGPRVPDLSKLPPRDPKTRPELMDLTGQYNGRLDDFWQMDPVADVLQLNHLGSMPRGVQRLGSVDFDVRGVVQLSSRRFAAAGSDLPKAVRGIRVGQKCHRLHFLHGTQWRVEDGTRIGTYVLHFTDGSMEELPILYGVQVRDWWSSGTEEVGATSARVVWKGANAATQKSGASLRIFDRTVDNPHPEKRIETLDLVSAMSDSAPFVLAVTVE